MRLPLSVCTCLLAALAPATGAPGQTPNEIIRDARYLAPKDAIDQQGLVQIGGIPQWISVRARHRRSPILLVVHGGPGFTLSPTSFYYLRDLEEYFTVVQWDQRGAGKTYAASDPEKIKPTMSVDRLVDDGAELIRYLTKTYGQQRVVLLGHSFGTVIGTRLALKHPELLYAYVGTGQFVDFVKSESDGYRQTLADAEAAHNSEAVRQLRSIAPFPDAQHPERNVQNLGTERRWLAEYGGYYAAGGVGHNEAIAKLSPDHDAHDLQVRNEAQGFSDRALWGELGHVSFLDQTRFRIPVVIIEGRHDRGTSSALVAGWFDRIRAPSKRMIWFEDSAHMTFEEEPGKFLVTLVDQVLPLTKR